MTLFLDANVVFSAAHREESRAQDLVALARGGRCKLLTSAYALEEARRNLELKSSGFEQRLADSFGGTDVVAEALARALDLVLKDVGV